ncbi:hypothetical protein ABVK25_009455 [Lepraria finkii]|uniref:Uncharacterized protein n=1 Tax=Lepraria finkii TaxID=1340010 RepID=A0ABR4AXF4_9LECA
MNTGFLGILFCIDDDVQFQAPDVGKRWPYGIWAHARMQEIHLDARKTSECRRMRTLSTPSLIFQVPQGLLQAGGRRLRGHRSFGHFPRKALQEVSCSVRGR